MNSVRKTASAAVAACAVSVFAAAATVPTHVSALSGSDLSAAVVGGGALSPDAQQFYSKRNFQPIWMGQDNAARAQALLQAVRSAGDHGLPVSRYRAAELQRVLEAHGPDAAEAELLATRIFLDYARDLTSGALEPSEADKEIAVIPPRRSEIALLDAVTRSTPRAFFKALAPRHPDYHRLLAEKKTLEAEMQTVAQTTQLPRRLLRRGSKGANVQLLRARLGELGYGDLGTEPVFDADLRAVVVQFQTDRELLADGIVGQGTIAALNGVSPEEQLKKVIVALERERWLNRDRGQRHIVVNIADFSFNLYDDGKPVFHSITVVGSGTSDRRTPEFHDEMTHMVVNPTWHVPRSIAGKEYLPQLKRDPGSLARQGLRVIGPSGRAINPANVDFSRYSARNFPYSIKQPPGARNALGRVKFMFPNRFNIYLHDTPSKSLFKRDVRAFSHGCVRVQRPFEFAHKLLEKQTANPEAAFDGWLRTGREQYVNLQTPVPVYLTYRTAFVGNDGDVQYRDDVYGRDERVWQALVAAGVASEAL